jgi:hypothetical protein
MPYDLGANELEILIGPLKEFQGANKLTGIRIVSNGSNNTLKATVNITKTSISTPNHSEIKIWNLSEETRNAINSSELRIEVYAGQEGQGNKDLIFTGGILNSVYDRTNKGIITTIIGLDGQTSLIRSTIGASFNANTPVRDVILYIANQLKGITIIPNQIHVIDNTTNQELVVGYKGISLIGSPKNCLDKLARQFGFSWSIQNGVFKVVKDGTYRQTGIVLSGRTRLVKVSPMLTGPTQQQKGVSLEGVYTRGLTPGDMIQVESVIDKQLNGLYGIHTLNYNLDPKGQVWNMRIESFITTLAEART